MEGRKTNMKENKQNNNILAEKKSLSAFNAQPQCNTAWR